MLSSVFIMVQKNKTSVQNELASFTTRGHFDCVRKSNLTTSSIEYITENQYSREVFFTLVNSFKFERLKNRL